jgi:peptide/nickel transport system permease protein
MLRFLIIRIAGIVPQLVLVSLLAFAVMKTAPGDPVASLAGGTERMTAADHARVSHNLGLDRPLPVQYGLWIRRVGQGDLGQTLRDGRAVSGILREAMGNTLYLVASVLPLMLVCAVCLGYVAGRRQNRWPDYLISGVSTLSVAVPPFWLGLILILIFSVQLDLFPSSGSSTIGGPGRSDRAWHAVLPVATIFLTHVGPYVRLVRGSIRRAAGADFVRAARARGLRPGTILWRYVMPNALGPFVTWAGFSLPLLFSSIFVIEWVFAWPGIGRVFLQAAVSREYPVMMGCVLVVCVMVILGNLLADCVVAALNPKLRSPSRD